jgi:hypothetical protein
MSVIPDLEQLRRMTIRELANLALRTDDRNIFWYLTGCISARLPLADHRLIALWESAHIESADYEEARRICIRLSRAA